jgi:hypothetical protein
MVKIVCPAAATCSIKRAYDDQLAVLRQISREEMDKLVRFCCVAHIHLSRFQPSRVHLTWFDGNDVDHPTSDPGAIYVSISRPTSGFS